MRRNYFQVKLKNVQLREMEAVISHLESKHPNIQQIVHSRLEMERKVKTPWLLSIIPLSSSTTLFCLCR